MPRHAAFLCLRSGSTKPLRSVDRIAASRGLDARDTALVRRIVGTEIRRRGTLRAVVGAFAHTKPKADLATLMRIGIAQILYLDRVPDHAAVSETVRAAADFLGIPKGRVLNGVLRTVLREMRPGWSGDPTRDMVGAKVHFDFPMFRDPGEHPHLWAEDALSVPAALHKRWTQRFGLEEANELGRLAADEPPLSLRVTAQQPGGRDAVAEELRATGLELTPGAHPDVLLAGSDATSSVVGSAAFTEGRITIQGEHALRAAHVAGSVEGKDVLDLCAAPGGKSAVLAEGGPRSLVALDVSAYRIARLRPSFERLRLAPPALAAMHGTSALRGDARFDVVLVDAPCSNTGVLGARPAARWRYGPKNQAELATLQLELLDAASSHVRPGGALVHSTCSLESEENERVVRQFIATRDGWEIEEELSGRPRPREQGGPIDGGYAARLRSR